MTTYAQRSQPFFLTPIDEKSLEAKLKSHFQNVAFVDGIKWPSPIPPTKAAISDCNSPIIYLWNRENVSELPCKKLNEGVYQGPSSGVVIQFLRSRLKDGVLYSGDASIGFDVAQEAIGHFVADCWKILESLNSCALDGFDPKTLQTLDKKIKSYVVGEDARQLALSGTLMRHCSADVYYQPRPPSNSQAKNGRNGP